MRDVPVTEERFLSRGSFVLLSNNVSTMPRQNNTICLRLRLNEPYIRQTEHVYALFRQHFPSNDCFVCKFKTSHTWSLYHLRQGSLRVG
jgi:hypothetical protein